MASSPPPFLYELNETFVYKLNDDKESLFYLATESQRIGGSYWGVSTLALLDKLHPHPSTTSSKFDVYLKKEEVFDFIQKCKRSNGGYGPAEGHDSHIVSTHYAVLILSIYNRLDLLDTEAIIQWISTLQLEDGSFKGDEWGEVDTRFVYCALSCLTILGGLCMIDVSKAKDYILRCRNYDGGFGWVPNGESHAASVFCCVAGLALTESIGFLDRDSLGWWLCERQTPSGGFNGRPEKAPDVCYSWWILASLHITGRQHWMDTNALTKFVLEAQDVDDGGIADRPGDVSDVFHTFFGIAALSLMNSVDGLKPIHPVYALPTETVELLKLPNILYTQNNDV